MSVHFSFLSIIPSSISELRRLQNVLNCVHHPHSPGTLLSFFAGILLQNHKGYDESMYVVAFEVSDTLFSSKFEQCVFFILSGGIPPYLVLFSSRPENYMWNHRRKNVYGRDPGLFFSLKARHFQTMDCNQDHTYESLKRMRFLSQLYQIMKSWEGWDFSGPHHDVSAQPYFLDGK